MRERPRKWCLSGFEWALIIVAGWAVIVVIAS